MGNPLARELRLFLPLAERAGTPRDAAANVQVDTYNPALCDWRPGDALFIAQAASTADLPALSTALGRTYTDLTSYSFTAWLALHTLAVNYNRAAYVVESTTGGDRFGFQRLNGALQLDSNGAAPGIDGPTVVQDEWYLCTGVHDADTSTVTFYVNGGLVGSGSVTKPWLLNNIGVLMLATSETGTTYGMQDQSHRLVMLHDRALSAAEVKRLHEDPYAPIRKRRVFVPVAAAAQTDLSGAAQSSATGQASLTADVPISGAAVSVASASGGLASSVPLTGAGYAASIGSASLQAGADLSGAAQAQASGSGSVALSVRLDGAAVAAAIAQAALSAGVDLSGQAAAGSGGSGALSTGADLSGDAQAQAAGSGSITIQVTLDGSAISEALASAGLDSGSGDLSGAAAAGASGAAAMIMDVPVAGSAASVSSADGSLSAILPLRSVAVSGSSATGGLTVQAGLDGQAVANAMASGVLAVDAGSTLSGDAVAESAGSGVLSLRLTLNGGALANAVASAMLTGTLDALVVRRWTVSAVRRDFTVRARG